MNTILIILTVMFAGIRGIMSKELSGIAFGSKSFFKTQSILFLSGWCIIVITNPRSACDISHTTFLLSLLYAVFPTSAQWCYTFSLSKGNMGMCSTIYSMGFILPAISGYLFWDETLTNQKSRFRQQRNWASNISEVTQYFGKDIKVLTKLQI